MAEKVIRPDIQSTLKPSWVENITIGEVLRLVGVGFLTGALVWLAKIALDNWVVSPLFCRTPDTFSVCQNGGTLSFGVALVLVGFLSVSTLSLAKVSRPLLIALFALGGLWGVSLWLGQMDWWWAVVACGVLAAVSFGLFGMVARIKSFLVAFVVGAVLVCGLQILIHLQ